MISWTQIAYGAVLSGLLAAAALALIARSHRSATSITGGVATLSGPFAWNAILRAAHGDQFFTDAPIAVLPASWQDTGSGVFALATASLLLGLLALPREEARRVAAYSAICGIAAFAVDIYLY